MISITVFIAALLLAPPAVCTADTDTKTVCLFIFAGRSNMEDKRKCESRQDLALPALKWVVSQQAPAEGNGLDQIDITANLAAADFAFIQLKLFSIPPQQEELVIPAAGIVELSELLAKGNFETR